MKKPTTSRVSQMAFLSAFLLLFVRTEYRGSDTVPAAINSFFRADPLVLVSYLLSARAFTWILLPAVLVALCTLLLGRFFCGWICPLGTVIDLVTGRIRKTAPLSFLRGSLKYWLLFPLLSLSLFDANLAGLLDPLAILVRALTFLFYPLFGHAVRQGWVGLYRVMDDARDHLAPAYEVLRDNLLPFRETFYPLAFLSALMFLAIIFLERFERRNWCRNICPLGTLLGLLSRFSLFKRLPAAACADCGDCRSICPTSFREGSQGSSGNAAAPSAPAASGSKEQCILCTECLSGCRLGRARFTPALPKLRRTEYLPARRVVIGGLLSGFLLSGAFRFRSPEARARVLRPPGVRSEADFLAKCVRCGECMKVCLKAALYPAFLQAGPEALYTPVLIPRLGYCEYNCTLCGQVCPTGAITRLPVEEKKRAVIGKAVFDRNHCLPYAKKINCIVCEEHCPVGSKAIRSEKVQEIDAEGSRIELQKPYVVTELCNGCGICENVCPLEGKAGIEVFAVQDKTPLA